MTLPTGARLGRYQIADCIGAGGMGVVYRAYDPALERDVALKVLGPGLLEEARIVAALDHPHICAVYDVGVVDDTPFMAMQLIKGQSLRALLSSGPLPPDKVRRIGRQLAEGLEHAHGHGVIHRDFKTPNVMIAADGAAKIVDFGISVRLAEPTDQTLTADAVGADVKLSGTVPYMAPEVLRGQRPDARSDIWALGVVLYEMAAGRVPFHATTAPATIAAILNDRWPPLPPGTPAGLVRVIERCLAKDPPDRPARAGEVALALDVIDSQPSAATLVAPSRRPRAHLWSRRAVGAVAVLAIGALVYMAWARRATPPSPIRFGNPVQITTAVGVEEFPAWSSDGRMLAYVGRARGSIDNSPDSNSDIWVAQPGSGTPINRTGDHEGRDLFPAWSHDGSQISFWSDRDGPGCYVMNALSGAPRRIAAANAINPNPPQWSPDGRSIGCVTGERKASLDVISVETGQIQERIELPGEIPRFVTRSQDGRLIAYVSGPGGLNADLTRLNVLVVASATVRTITDGQTLVTSPNWSADGRTLYYVAHAGATMDLWEQRMNADGSAAGAPDTVTAGVGIKNATLSPDGRRLAYSQGRKLGNVWRLPFRPDRPATWSDAEQITFDQAYIECVSLSRDGTMLAINSDRAGSIDLWTLPSSGGEMTQITSDLSAEWCPDWSPDGSMLAFYAHRTGNREIWTVPAKGGEWRQLTDHPGPDLHPSWSSDGQLIVHLTGGRNGGGGGWISRFDGGPGWMVVSPNVIALRWSPTDARLAYISADRIWLLDTKATIAATSLTTTFSGALRWTPDGTAILHRMRGDTINAIDAAGKGPSRLLADLSGRPGQLGFYGTPTDGRSIYFVWHEDLGDVWVMDAVPPNQ